MEVSAGYDVTSRNSIVSGNSVAGHGSAAADVYGTISYSNGHNIFGSDVVGAARATFRTCRRACCSQAGSPTTAGRPRRSPCAMRRTTRPSPAPTRPSPATDQRGEARPQPDGTNPDIGAFELNQTGGGLNEIVGTGATISSAAPRAPT